MRLTSSVVCGAGKIRETNQDNFYLNGPYGGKVAVTFCIAPFEEPENVLAYCTVQIEGSS